MKTPTSNLQGLASTASSPTCGQLLRGLALSVFLSFIPISSSHAVDVPPSPDGCGLEGEPCLTFIDFDVYSLSLLQSFQSVLGLFDGLDFVEKPNDADVTIFDTDGNGTAAQGSGTDIDDAYQANTGQSAADNMLFLMTSSDSTSGGSDIPSDPLPNGDIWDNNLNDQATVNSWDTYVNHNDQFGDKPEDFMSSDCLSAITGCMQLWDADVDALKAAIDDPNTATQEGLGFFFINNETGDDGLLAGKDVLAWAKVTLHNCDTDNPTLCDADDMLSFVLGGDPNTQNQLQYDAQTAPGNNNEDGVMDPDNILPTAEDYWAHVHSDVCMNDGSADVSQTGAVFLGSCTEAIAFFASINVAGWTGQSTVAVDQSLGVDEAGFMAISSALNTAFLSGDYKYLTMDVRFSHLNNGGDVLWIGGVSQPENEVPLPTTLLLFSAGLLSLALVRRYRSTLPLKRPSGSA